MALSSGSRDGGQTFFRVTDNGVGSAATILRTAYGIGRVGLWSIEHRLNQLDARLEVTGNNGLCVTVVIPPWRKGIRRGLVPAPPAAAGTLTLAHPRHRRARS